MVKTLIILLSLSATLSDNFDDIETFKNKGKQIKVCKVFNVVPVENYDLYVVYSMIKAINYWNGVLEKQVFAFNKDDFNNIIIVEIRKGVVGKAALIYIHAGKDNCVLSTKMEIYNELLTIQPYALETVFRHELGHFLTLAHTKEKGLMNRSVSSDIKVHPLNATQRQIDYIKNKVIKGL